MFFFILYSLWTPVTFETSIRGDPSKKFWKEDNSNFHMIPITQNINFAPRDRFSQITSHMFKLDTMLLFLNSLQKQFSLIIINNVHGCNDAIPNSTMQYQIHQSNLFWAKLSDTVVWKGTFLGSWNVGLYTKHRSRDQHGIYLK